MATRASCGGKLYAGRNFTVTPSGKDICEIAERHTQVVKITAGPITPRKGTGRGGRRVKLRVDELRKSISLSVIGDGARQDVHVQLKEMTDAREWFREKIISTNFTIVD